MGARINYLYIFYVHFILFAPSSKHLRFTSAIEDTVASLVFDPGLLWVWVRGTKLFYPFLNNFLIRYFLTIGFSEQIWTLSRKKPSSFGERVAQFASLIYGQLLEETEQIQFLQVVAYCLWVHMDPFA